jgi:type VII secretion protein EccB
MPSTPTTKSQVQAYRFVLRRMQSALVRKDAVMLHEPMRMHTRATIVGVCVAAIGVVGFLVWGLLSPDPKPPNEDGIVISKQSGQVYVLISQPTRQLIPTFNLASARLLLVARQQSQGQAQPGGTAAQLPQGTSADLKEPTMVDEKELKDIPRGRLTGIQNGPDLLPKNDQRIDARWAVCDKYKLDPSLNDPARDGRAETTVLGGVPDLGRELGESEALLVQAPNKVVYLVYRTPTDANITNANAVRAEVDMSDSTVRAALNLTVQDVRQISAGLLNAIPEAPKLAAPRIAGRDTAPDGFTIQGQAKDLKVGEVFSIQRAGQSAEFYVVHKNGIELIKQTTADLIRFTKSIDTGITPVSPDEVAGVQAQNAIDDSKSPEVQTEVLKAVEWPVACLGWNLVGEGDNTDHHTAVHVGSSDVPLPKRLDGSTHEAISISTPSADGQRIDNFFMPPGRAAVVRGSTSKEDFYKGPIYLVSDRGVKYGVPDAATAATLGLTDQLPAPNSIMSLLPSGASLNTRDVLQTYDTVPVGPGTFQTQGPQAGGGR